MRRTPEQNAKLRIHTGAISFYFYTSTANGNHTQLANILRENPWQTPSPSNRFPPSCTKSGHVLVDALHSIDFTGDKVASFLLTQKLKGVEP